MIKNCKFKTLLLIYYVVVVLGATAYVAVDDDNVTHASTKLHRYSTKANVKSFGSLELKSLNSTSKQASSISLTKKPNFYYKPTSIVSTTTGTYLLIKQKTSSTLEISVNETAAHTFNRLNDFTQPLMSTSRPSIVVSTTAITTTEMPTTTTAVPIYAHILDFKLIMSSFKPETNTIEIGYIINANVTSLDSNIFLDIEINCSCAKTNQTWSKSGQHISNKTSYSSTTMSPRIQPIPGSFLLCQATATNINLKEQNFSSFQSFSLIYLLIDPLPATSLVIKSINSTSLELNWQNPIYFYDTLQIVCYLNEIAHLQNEPYLNQTILNSNPDLINNAINSNQILVINNLKPGAHYNCTIYTVRYENEEFFSTVKSQTVKEMTSKLKNKDIM
jgi:hypothetical protein